MNRLEKIEAGRNRMLAFLEQAPIVIPVNSRIAGFSKIEPALWNHGDTWDSLHFPLGTAYLEYGFAGVARRAERNMGQEKTPEENGTLSAIAAVYDAVCAFLRRHGETARSLGREEMAQCLSALAERPPETFYEAVQAFYFAWKLRSLHWTATVGRLDRYLYPFYRRDAEAGRMDETGALELLCDLWRRMNESGSGDTLMNVMLGGLSPDGTDETNDLSVLMARASRSVRLSEPHINYRWHKGMREDFLREITRLQLMGHGQGTLFQDEVLIPAMIAAGVRPEHAYDYANDGCTEVICDRKSIIYMRVFETVKCLELALWNGNPPPLPGEPVVGYWTCNAPAGRWNTGLKPGVESGECETAADFETVLQNFKTQLRVQLTACARALIEEYRTAAREFVSPAFVNGTFPEVLETGKDCVCGLPETCLTLFAGALPTVADSLAALKTVVFEQKRFTMGEVLEALRDNFDGHDEVRRALLAAPKFGNDDDLPDSIAAHLAQEILSILLEVTKQEGVRLWPSLFGHMFVQESWYTGATPDGRKWTEPLAPHFSPVPGRAGKGPTAVFASAAKTDVAPFIGNAPVYIALSRSAVPEGEAGEALVRALFDGAAESGMSCVNLAIHDVEEMRRAQKDPAAHGDLIVRVWGYSARFVDLTPEMQEHIIARTAGK